MNAYYLSKDTFIRDDIMIEWVELGEGLCGDYNPNDPKDIELLRFDVSYRNRNPETPNDPDIWLAFDDASYCTQFPAKATEAQRIEGLKMLMDYIYEPASHGQSIKKICERLSWIGLKNLETNYIESKWTL